MLASLSPAVSFRLSHPGNELKSRRSYGCFRAHKMLVWLYASLAIKQTDIQPNVAQYSSFYYNIAAFLEKFEMFLECPNIRTYHYLQRCPQIISGIPSTKSINLELLKAEVILIFGPSGSGKSTFICVINHLSDSQQQQVAIAKELAMEPKLKLIDE